MLYLSLAVSSRIYRFVRLYLRLFPIPFAILHEEPRDSIVKINQLVIYASNFQLVTILEPFCDLARGIIKDL